MQTRTDAGEDVIDLRDLTDRFEEIEESEEEEEVAERKRIASLLADLKGYGGDHDWRGDWYPGALIRDDYMETYARQTAEDIGAIKGDEPWPCSYIDWEAATDAFKQDYSTVEYGGVTYYYR